MRTTGTVKLILGLLLSCSGMLGGVPPAFGQISTAPSAQTGLSPSASYFNADLDHINLYNGNLFVDLPVMAPPAQDLPTGIRLRYNSQKWQEYAFNDWYVGGRYTGGWQVDVPTHGLEVYEPWLEDCIADVGVWSIAAVWTDGSGMMHEFRNDAANGGDCYNTPPQTVTLPSVSAGRAVMRLTLGVEGPPYASYEVQLKDGTMISGNIPYSSQSAYLTSVNGSSALYERNPGARFQVNVQDSIGRGYGWNGLGCPSECRLGYRFKDSAGDYQLFEVQLLGVRWTYDPVTPGWFQSAYPELLSKLVLPNNKFYEFEYSHDQGFMTKIILPSGGYIRYVYANGNSTAADDDYVVERYVSADGTTEQKWTFERDITNEPTTRIITVRSPEAQGGSPTVGPVKHYFNELGLEYKTEWYAPNGEDILKVVETEWDYDDVGESGQPINPRSTTVTTTISGLKQQVTMTYDANGNMETMEESDWFTGETPVKLRNTLNHFVNRTGTLIEFQRMDSTVTQVWNGTNYDTVVQKTEFELDTEGDVTSIKRYSGASTYVTETYTYNGPHITSITDADNNTTTIGYTPNYRSGSFTGQNPPAAYPTSITNAEGHVTEFEYDYNTGLVTKTTDARGFETEFTYDPMGRPLVITEDASGRETTYTYNDDPESNPLSVLQEVLVSSGVKRKVKTSFDLLGRPVKTERQDPAGTVTVDTEYDGNGRVKRVSDPRRSGDPVWTTTAYDSLDRPVTISRTEPDTTSRTFSYAANSVTAMAEDGIPRRQVFNGIGQMIRVDELNPALEPPTLANPLSTMYKYNVAGALLEVCQYANNSTGACAGASLVRTFNVNWLGQVIEETHPESGTTAYTYYDNGLLHTRVDARSITTTYTYDGIGRITGIDYSDSTPDVTLAYDEGSNNDGLLTSMETDGVETVTMAYSNAGLLASEERQFSGVSGSLTTSYEYDYDGRLTEVTYPSGRVVTRTYQAGSGTAADRLNTVTDTTTSSTLLTSVADNAAGQLTGRTIGAVEETRQFNARNQLTQIEAKVNSVTQMKLGYGYGTTTNTGRILSRTDELQPEHAASYTYDPLGRLTGAANFAWNIGWAYDAWGNRTHQTASGEASGRVANATNVTFDDNRNMNYTYDAAGHVTQVPVGGGNVTLTWDAEGRMKTYGSYASYTYDGLGRRVTRTEGSETTYYVYGLTGLMSEFTTVDTGATAAAATDRIRYQVGEANGTAVLITETNGTVIENNRRFPFGEPFQGSEDAGSTNDQKFTTYDRDQATQLDYAMARWYASREGRFMSPDPGNAGVDLVSPQTWNLYVYVSNDPINQIDPTGLCRKAVIRVTSYAGEDGSFGPAVPDDPSDLDLSEECGFLSQLFGGFLDNAIGIGGLFGLGQLFGGETSTLGLTEGAASAPARIPRRPMEKFQETAPSNQSGIVSSADEYLLHRPWVVSWIVPIKPVPFIAGFGPAGSFAWNPNTHTACIGIGGGASAGKNVSYGPLTHGYMWDGRKWPDGADDVLSGVALSGGFNFPWLVGGQGTIGFSGAAMGPSLGVPGGALSITYSHCMGF